METGRNSRILIVGGGSWATALVKILSQMKILYPGG